MPTIETIGPEDRVFKAASEPLRLESQSPGGHWNLTEEDLRANAFRPTKPDPKTVIIQAVETNPLVKSFTDPPAEVASMIPLYPVFGLRSGRRRRADPEGSNLEKVAWSVLRGYTDDCGSQESLIARHFAAKRGPGEAVQVRYKHPDTGQTVYEIVLNRPSVLTQNRDKSWMWHRSSGNDRRSVRLEEGDVRRTHIKGFTFTDSPTSTLMPLADLIAAWELTLRALFYGTNTSILLGGMIIGPPVDGPRDWTTDWFDWIRKTSELGLMRIPFPLAAPDGREYKLLEPGQTIQEGLIKLHELLTKELARYSGIDPQLALEGTGNATHWNGVIMQRHNLQSFIAPTLARHVLDDVVAWPYRPALAATGLPFDVLDWGILGDWRQIAIQPDQLDKLMLMADKGWIKPTVPMQSIGIEESEMILPGSPDFEAWAERTEIIKGRDLDEEGPPSRQPVGVGGETFGPMPDNEADDSTTPNPTQRTSVLAPTPADLEVWDDLGDL